MTLADDVIAKLRVEKDRLTLVKENAALRAEIRATEAPWWRRATVVTTLTAILAAVVPATSAIQGHFEKTREIDLEKEKQKHTTEMEDRRQAEDIRTGYLDRMKTPGEHLRTLRFLLATTTDGPLRTWAEAEKKIVEDERAAADAMVATAASAARDADAAALAAASKADANAALTAAREHATRAHQRLDEARRVAATIPPPP